jgi:hypothetical protein
MPEGMVSGDNSNNNFASTLVAEAPFVKAMECRQDIAGREYVEIHERVLDHASINGLLPGARGDILDELEIMVSMPPVIPRDALKETQRNEILSDHAIMGNGEWSGREDLKRDEQLADMARDPIQQPSITLGMEGQDQEGDESREKEKSNVSSPPSR